MDKDRDLIAAKKIMRIAINYADDGGLYDTLAVMKAFLAPGEFVPVKTGASLFMGYMYLMGYIASFIKESGGSFSIGLLDTNTGHRANSSVDYVKIDDAVLWATQQIKQREKEMEGES